MGRVDALEYLGVGLPPRGELSHVRDERRVGGFQRLHPPHAVLPQEVEFYRKVVEPLDVLHPQGRCADGVSLVLVLLVADPHPDRVDQVTDRGDLPLPLVSGPQLVPDLLLELREGRPNLEGLVVLLLVAGLLDVRAFVWPDVLLLLRELVYPAGEPDRLVVVDYLSPVSERLRGGLVQVERDV